MHKTIVAVLLLLTTLQVPAAGQQVEREPLFQGSDAAWAAAFLAGTAALAPVDRYLAERLQDPRLQQSRSLRYTATSFRVLAHPGALVGVTGAYAIGRITGNEGLADVGLHAGAALVVAEGATYLGKFLAGRARPRVAAGDAFDFELLRGLTFDFQSFPSGHTSAAFAVASALTNEAGERRPRDQWWIGALLYSGAALGGISRMYNNEHWASDIAAGAALGTFAGWKVVEYTHGRPGNDLNSLFLNVSVQPGRGVTLSLLPRAWSPLAN